MCVRVAPRHAAQHDWHWAMAAANPRPAPTAANGLGGGSGVGAKTARACRGREAEGAPAMRAPYAPPPRTCCQTPDILLEGNHSRADDRSFAGSR